MKFTQERPTRIAITKLSERGVCIGNEWYSATVALTPDTIIPDWPTIQVEALTISDFAALLADNPELIVLGTGSAHLFVPRELSFAFARRGVGLEVMDTGAAARTFNVLAGEGRKLAAVLYIDA